MDAAVNLAPSPASDARVKVLVVDDDRAVRDVLCALLVDEGYEVESVGGARQALETVASVRPEIVLSDMKMPEHDGMWLLDELQREHPDVGVLLLTGYGDTETAVECLRRGAMDYLLKPPRVVDLVKAVERALSRQRSNLERQRYQAELEARVRAKTAELSRALLDVEDAYTATLSALVAALDAREQETSDHSQRVVRMTLAIAEVMGLEGEALADVGRGALLHDIGKIGVVDAILLKPGPLTPAEWVEMRKHPEVGYQIISGIEFLRPAAEIVLAHQERWDGGGYPRGLKGEEIPLGARIFAIADTFDAIVTSRPYRKGQPIEAARAEILRCRGSQFDPMCVDAFMSLDLETLTSLHNG